MRNNLPRRAAALAAAIVMLLSSLPAALAEGEEITLSTAEDLKQFAQNCRLDAWSRGKTVRLGKDIDLGWEAFTPIPTFGGTFLGEGHTILGLNLHAEGADAGFFRYVQPGAVVDGLRLSGTVTGESDNVGGVAGVNRGTLHDCVFTGGVQGESAVGGIAGYNEAEGEITGCSTAGAVQGSASAGGIAGKNRGLLLRCRNTASVNTTIRDEQDVQELLEADLIDRMNQVLRGNTTPGMEKLLDSCFDTGGVVGWSGGIVQGCENTGSVGYSHVGYNTGGIAGRQAGFLDSCVNTGAILGRKDVGGIVGQAEPDIALALGENALRNLRTELDTLRTLLDRALDHTDNSRADLSDRLSALGESTDSARESSKALIDGLYDFADGNVATLNTATASLNAALTRADTALDHFTAASRSMEDMTGDLSAALEATADALDLSEPAQDQLKDSLDAWESGVSSLTEAMDELKAARSDLERAVTLKDRAAIRAALNRMADSLAEQIRAADTLLSSLETIRRTLEGQTELQSALDALDQVIQAAKEQRQALEDLRARLASAAERAEEGAEALRDSRLAIPADTAAALPKALDTLQKSLRDLASGSPDLSERAAAMENQVSALKNAIEDMKTAREDLRKAIADNNREAARAAMDRVSQAVDRQSQARDDLRAAMEEQALNGKTEYQAALDALEQVSGAVDDERAAAESLRSALSSAGDQVEFDEDALEDSLDDLDRAADSLSDALAVLPGALEAMNGALQDLDAPADSLREAVEQLQKATEGDLGEELGAGFESLSQAAKELESTDWTITPISEDTQNAGEDLYSALSQLSSGMEDLRASVDSSGDSLSADLRSINAQLGRVLDAVEDTSDEIDEREDTDLVEDVSEEDITGERLGKVSLCQNRGTVEGDRNVGGIAGSVGIELDTDPENDLIDDLSYDSTFASRAILYANRNTGSVSAKKNCAGGIAGLAELGAILNCENYADAESTGGSFTGGIAGRSDGVIRRCWSKGTFRGKDHVGGIAGEGTTVTACRAIAAIPDAESRAGAIAGHLAEDGAAYGNLFLDTGTAGIDGVSYAEAAEPASYEALLALNGPTEFLSFTVTFRTEDQTVAALPFRYGDDLSTLQPPQVPEQEGMYGRWPEFDTSGVLSDVVVEAVYTPWVTLLPSEEHEGELALALAEGRFTREDTLHAQHLENETPAQKDGMVYSLTLSPKESVPVRLWNPFGDGARVYVRNQGGWTQADAAPNGQYLILSLQDGEGVFCVCPRDKTPFIIAACAALGAAAVLALFLVRKKKKAPSHS